MNRNPTMDYSFASMTDEQIKLHMRECDWDERMSPNVGIPDYLNHPDTHNTSKNEKLKSKITHVHDVPKKQRHSHIDQSPHVKMLENNLSLIDPTYDSVAATFGFSHHEGTDPELELEVLKCILVREGLISKLRDIVKKMYTNPQVGMISKVYSRRVDGSSSSKKDVKRQVLRILTECREGTFSMSRWKCRDSIGDMVRNESLTNNVYHFIEKLSYQVTTKLTSCILAWRRSTNILPPRPFFWRSENYLLRVWYDLNFLSECTSLVNALKIPKEKMINNPLMLPNNLNNAISPEYWFSESNKPIIPMTDDDANIQDEQKRKERMMIRKAEAVLVIERKYQDIQNAGKHLGDNFLHDAIDLLLPQQEQFPNTNKVTEPNVSLLKWNTNEHLLWKEMAKKQLTDLEKRVPIPRELLIPKSNNWKPDIKNKNSSIPEEVICFKSPPVININTPLPTVGQSPDIGLIAEKSFLTQEGVPENDIYTTSIFPNNAGIDPRQKRIHTNKTPKSQSYEHRHKSYCLNHGQTHHKKYSLQSKGRSLGTENKGSKNEKPSINILSSSTGDVVSTFTIKDQNEILSIKNPSWEEIWVAEIIQTILCCGHYAPTNLSWERFQDRIEHKSFIQSLRSVDFSSIKGPKLGALVSLLKNQSSTASRSISPSIAKLAMWSAKYLKSVLVQEMNILNSLHILESMFIKREKNEQKKRSEIVSKSSEENKVKIVRKSQARVQMVSHPVVVGKELGPVLYNGQHKISNRNVFVSCFLTKKRNISVKVYDASSSEEYRNTFKIPPTIKSDDERKTWIINSLLEHLRLNGKSIQSTKLVVLPSAYNVKNATIRITENSEIKPPPADNISKDDNIHILADRPEDFQESEKKVTIEQINLQNEESKTEDDNFTDYICTENSRLKDCDNNNETKTTIAKDKNIKSGVKEQRLNNSKEKYLENQILTKSVLQNILQNAEDEASSLYQSDSSYEDDYDESDEDSATKSKSSSMSRQKTSKLNNSAQEPYEARESFDDDVRVDKELNEVETANIEHSETEEKAGYCRSEEESRASNENSSTHHTKDIVSKPSFDVTPNEDDYSDDEYDDYSDFDIEERNN